MCDKFFALIFAADWFWCKYWIVTILGLLSTDDVSAESKGREVLILQRWRIRYSNATIEIQYKNETKYLGNMCIRVCECTCVCVLIYTVRHSFPASFLNGAINVVCSVLCSFCIWSLWTLGTNSSTSSNPLLLCSVRWRLGQLTPLLESHFPQCVSHTLTLFPYHLWPMGQASVGCDYACSVYGCTWSST